MAVPNYKIRSMLESEIPKAVKLWSETGYEEPKNCLNTWLQVDPNGFQVAVTDSGEVIGLGCAIVHNEESAHFGMYVVKKTYRGLGIGMGVFKACMDHVGDRSVALDAVQGKLELYRDRGGFPIVETGWFSIICDAGRVNPAVLLKEVDGIELRPITDATMPLVLDYDLSLIGYQRDKLISLTVKEGETTSYLAVRNNKCVGYGVHKMGTLGNARVGPLYADSQAIAEVILRRLIETLPQADGFTIVVINTNTGAKSILDKLDVPFHMEAFTRTYKKKKIEADTNKVFSLFDQNFSPY